MTVVTLVLMMIILILSTDEDVKIVMLFSGCLLASEYLFWLSDSQYYYVRHVVSNLILALLCFWFKRKDFNWAGMTCIIYACVFTYESLHTYKSPIYHYLTTIQTVLMQLYLIALTYKSDWRIPCLKRQRI